MKNGLTFILILLSLTTGAQVSGYMGKKILLKTDLSAPLLDKGISFQAEAALLRNLSVEIGIQTINRSYNQTNVYYVSYYDDGDYPDEKAHFNGSYFFGKVKLFTDI